MRQASHHKQQTGVLAANLSSARCSSEFVIDASIAYAIAETVGQQMSTLRQNPVDDKASDAMLELLRKLDNV